MMLDKKVKEIMTTDVITTPSNVDVVNAFEELMEHKISECRLLMMVNW